MKTIINLTITLVAIIGLAMTGCEGPAASTKVDVTGITLAPAALTLNVGATGTLTSTITPADATNQKVSWTTSDATKATVANGVVTAVATGSATITVTTDDGGFTATCAVTVSPTTAVTGVTLNKTAATLKVGDTETLTATVEPADATNKAISWSSSDNAVATVNNGVVSAVGAGTATITVTTTDGGKTAACAVTVQAIASSGTKTLSSISAVFNASHTVYTTTPLNDLKTHLTVSAAYSDGATAAIDADDYTLSGTLTEGASDITVSYTEGGVTQTTTFNVTVNAAPDYGIALSPVNHFTAAAFGYAAQTGQTVTVTNIGLQATGNLSIAINPTTGFDLSPTAIASIATGSAATFTVTPKTGLNAGAHTATITVSNADISDDVSVSFTVNKAAGAAVSAPSGAVTITQTSITLTAVSAPGNSQTVEYARSNSATAPSSGWQDGEEFTGLIAGTQYYFFARAKLNSNYETGTASGGTAFTTQQALQNVPVVLTTWEGDSGIGITGAVTVTPGDSLVLEADGTYDSYRWTVNGVFEGTNATFTLGTANRAINKDYHVGLEAVKGGKYYFAQIIVTIE